MAGDGIRETFLEALGAVRSHKQAPNSSRNIQDCRAPHQRRYCVALLQNGPPHSGWHCTPESWTRLAFRSCFFHLALDFDEFSLMKFMCLIPISPPRRLGGAEYGIGMTECFQDPETRALTPHRGVQVCLLVNQVSVYRKHKIVIVLARSSRLVVHFVSVGLCGASRQVWLLCRMKGNLKARAWSSAYSARR